MNALRAHVAFLVVAGTLAASSASHAAKTHKGEDAAREYNRAGITALKAGDDEAALTSFERAYELYPDPKIRLNMALAHEKLRRLDEAQEHYEAFLKQNPLHEKAKQAKRKLKELEAEKAAAGKVIILVEPAPETLEFAGRRFARLPAKVWLPPGSYPLRARKAGYEPFDQMVDVRKGDRFEVRVALVVEAAPPTTTEPAASAVPAEPAATAETAAAATPPAPAPATEESPAESPSRLPLILRATGVVVALLVLPLVIGAIAGVAMIGASYGAVVMLPGTDWYRELFQVAIGAGTVALVGAALLFPLPLAGAVGAWVVSFFIG